MLGIEAGFEGRQHRATAGEIVPQLALQRLAKRRVVGQDQQPVGGEVHRGIHQRELVPALG